MRTWSRLHSAALVWLAVPIASAGCGLVEGGAADDVNLSIVEKQFAIDATVWNVNESAVDTLLDQSCTPEADRCAAIVSSLSACKAATCTAQCNAETSKCQLALRVELWRAVNLAAEVPDLIPQSAPTMASSLNVTLDDVTYEIVNNGLSVDTPKLNVYVAPTTVMLASGDGAVRIAEIPAVPAGTQLSPRSISFQPGGKELLRRRLSDYQVPFNMIVAADLIVDEYTPVPVGELNANLQMRGRAGF